MGVISVLRNVGASVDLEDSEGRTALHTAADLGHTEVISTLLPAYPRLNKVIISIKFNYEIYSFRSS